MKLVYVVSDYTNSGGIERVISSKANYLVANGYEVYIVSCCHQDRKPFFEFDSKIKFHDLAIPSINDKYKNIFLERLSSYLNELKPDIVISTGMRVMNYLYEIKDGSKKVLELHFSKYRRKFNFASFESFYLGRLFLNLYYYKTNQLVKRYDKFIVLTEEDKKSWLVSDIQNIEVIPNPLPFIPARISDLKTKRIIAIGRHTYQKGFDILLEMWSKIEAKYPDWILTIFGDGTKRSKIEQKVDKLNLSTRIELHPPVSNVANEFFKSSIFALSSRYEGLPMVLLEAMVCGLPSVCFACKCGPRDVIENSENGFYVTQVNTEAFIERLEQLMNSEELRVKMGQLASEKIRCLEIDNVMPKWISLFENLVSS